MGWRGFSARQAVGLSYQRGIGLSLSKRGTTSLRPSPPRRYSPSRGTHCSSPLNVGVATPWRASGLEASPYAFGALHGKTQRGPGRASSHRRRAVLCGRRTPILLLLLECSNARLGIQRNERESYVRFFWRLFAFQQSRTEIFIKTNSRL